jgi:hypothetical protein
MFIIQYTLGPAQVGVTVRHVEYSVNGLQTDTALPPGTDTFTIAVPTGGRVDSVRVRDVGEDVASPFRYCPNSDGLLVNSAKLPLRAPSITMCDITEEPDSVDNLDPTESGSVCGTPGVTHDLDDEVALPPLGATITDVRTEAEGTVVTIEPEEPAPKPPRPLY